MEGSGHYIQSSRGILFYTLQGTPVKICENLYAILVALSIPTNSANENG